MDTFLKVTLDASGQIKIEKVKEVTAQDFAPVAKADDEGCAISFMLQLAEQSPWDFTRGKIRHTGTLRLAFVYAPQVKELVDSFRAKGLKLDQLTLTYLLDLFKVYEEHIEVLVKGRGTEAEDKSFKVLESLAEAGSQAAAMKAAKSFNKAISMLSQM